MCLPIKACVCGTVRVWALVYAFASTGSRIRAWELAPV